jgi:anti-anti-sigma regulatory factor
MPPQHIAVLHVGDVTVVAIAKVALAAINEDNHPSPVLGELCEEFGQAAAAASGGIVVDMRDTEFLDHASVSALFRLGKLLANRSKPWAICCSPAVKQVLHICKFDLICPVVTALDVAITRAGQRRQPEPGAAPDPARM